MTEPVPPSRNNEGITKTIINAVKNMTLTNALVIILLVIIGLPSYLLWRIMNDESILNKFLSYYEQISTDTTCTIHAFSMRGGGEQYVISTGFAFQGSDRWAVSVLMQKKPDEDDIVSNCATLELIVDFMRRPDAPVPTYPGTQEPMIWKYPEKPEGPAVEVPQ